MTQDYTTPNRGASAWDSDLNANFAEIAKGYKLVGEVGPTAINTGHIVTANDSGFIVPLSGGYPTWDGPVGMSYQVVSPGQVGYFPMFTVTSGFTPWSGQVNPSSPFWPSVDTPGWITGTKPASATVVLGRAFRDGQYFFNPSPIGGGDSGGGAGGPATVEVRTVSNYDLVVDDANKCLVFTSASGCLVNVTQQTSIAFNDYHQTWMIALGGQVTVVATGGASVFQPSEQNPTLNEQYSQGAIKRTEADVWVFGGDLEPVASASTPVIPVGTKGSDLASASSVDVQSGTLGDYRDVTGTATIEGLANLPEGEEQTLRFDSTPTLQHNGTSFILPTGDDIVCEAGDVAVFRGESGGNVVCVDYQRASGAALTDEVGTFTPTYEFQTPDGSTWSYTRQDASYARTNGICTFAIDIQGTPNYNGGSPSGSNTLNIPFTSSYADTGVSVPCNVLPVSVMNWGTNISLVFHVISHNSARSPMFGYGNNVSAAFFGTTPFPDGQSRRVQVGGSYAV